MELEDDLEAEGDPAHRLEEEAALAALAEDGEHAGAQLVERDDVEVEGRGVAAAAAEVLAEEVVGDAEEVGAEGGVGAEAGVAALAEGHECPLDQVLDRVGVAELVLEEAVDGGDVAIEELLAGPPFAGAPALEELVVVGHGSELAPPRRWGARARRAGPGEGSAGGGETRRERRRRGQGRRRAPRGGGEAQPRAASTSSRSRT